MYKKLTAPEYHLILQTVELNDGIYIKYKSSKAAHCDSGTQAQQFPMQSRG